MPTDRPIVLLCVSGSIAAYRAADVARDLMLRGYGVQVALTEAAQRFVTADLFSWLTERPALTDTFLQPAPGQMAHIDLAREASLFLCAPASAHTLAKFAWGLAGDCVGALHLAYRGPILVAPAMNPAMWAHPATAQNVTTLKARGVEFVHPDYGLVACGEEGVGKLAQVSDIVEAATAILERRRSMSGVSVLVTSGPTYEPIDPVRFIGNRSSGKMGHAIARAALERGASVTLISGPTAQPDPPGALTLHVRTASQMAEAVGREFENCDLFVSAAAIADFRPKQVAEHKIKRAGEPVLELEPTEDILAGVAARKGKRTVVGFAAETADLLSHARQKLNAKNLDLIVANDVTEEGSGFDSDSNRVTLLFANGSTEALPLLTKREVAGRILDALASPSLAPPR